MDQATDNPEGPSSPPQGKEVLYFTHFFELGKIASDILGDVLAILDSNEVFDHHDRQRAFLLLHEYNIRLEVLCLSYIKNSDHECVVCIGVFFGMLMWQVGDYVKQKGEYSIVLRQCSVGLLNKK